VIDDTRVIGQALQATREVLLEALRQK
jgi:hypothetical protein